MSVGWFLHLSVSGNLSTSTAPCAREVFQKGSVKTPFKSGKLLLRAHIRCKRMVGWRHSSANVLNAVTVHSHMVRMVHLCHMFYRNFLSQKEK